MKDRFPSLVHNNLTKGVGMRRYNLSFRPSRRRTGRHWHFVPAARASPPTCACPSAASATASSPPSACARCANALEVTWVQGFGPFRVPRGFSQDESRVYPIILVISKVYSISYSNRVHDNILGCNWTILKIVSGCFLIRSIYGVVNDDLAS